MRRVRALALPFSTRAVTPSSGSISGTCSVSPMDTGRMGSDSSGAAGQPVGTLTLLDGETEVLSVPILAAEDVPRRSWGSLFVQLLRTVSFAR